MTTSIANIKDFNVHAITNKKNSLPTFTFNIFLKENITEAEKNDLLKKMNNIFKQYNIKANLVNTQNYENKIILTVDANNKNSIKFLSILGINKENDFNIFTGPDESKINSKGIKIINNENNIIDFNEFKRNFNQYINNNKNSLNSVNFFTNAMEILEKHSEKRLEKHSLIEKLHSVSINIKKENNIFSLRIETILNDIANDKNYVISELDKIFKNIALINGQSIEIDSNNKHYVEFLSKLGITYKENQFYLDGKIFNNHFDLKEAFNGNGDKKRKEKLSRFSNLLNFYSKIQDEIQEEAILNAEPENTYEPLKTEDFLPLKDRLSISSLETDDSRDTEEEMSQTKNHTENLNDSRSVPFLNNIDYSEKEKKDETTQKPIIIFNLKQKINNEFKQTFSLFEKILAFLIKLFSSHYIKERANKFVQEAQQVKDNDQFEDLKASLNDDLNKCFFKTTRKLVLEEISCGVNTLFY
jgi:hypothetical protein